MCFVPYMRDVQIWTVDNGRLAVHYSTDVRPQCSASLVCHGRYTDVVGATYHALDTGQG